MPEAGPGAAGRGLLRGGAGVPAAGGGRGGDQPAGHPHHRHRRRAALQRPGTQSSGWWLLVHLVPCTPSVLLCMPPAWPRCVARRAAAHAPRRQSMRLAGDSACVGSAAHSEQNQALSDVMSQLLCCSAVEPGAKQGSCQTSVTALTAGLRACWVRRRCWCTTTCWA